MNGRWWRLLRWHRNDAVDEQDDSTDDDDDNDIGGDGDNAAELGHGSAVSRSLSEITFDKSLPRAHSYLGNDLEDVQGRTIHDDASIVTLPVYSLNDVVLLPGQILPLFLYDTLSVSMIKRVLDKDRTFAYIASSSHAEGMATVGTTAEILAVKEDQDELSGLIATKVKAIGRQRFMVNKTRRQLDGILLADVQILAEKVLPNPLEGATPLSHKRSSYSFKLNLVNRLDKHLLCDQPLFPMNSNKKTRNVWRGESTHWPSWVYKQYDISQIMSNVKKELRSWNESFSVESMPSDPVELSYWVAGSLPLEHSMKLKLLSIDSAVQRLRCELSLMRRCTVMCCVRCNAVITNKSDVFSMSVEGPLGAYVNPGGHVHETLTVVQAKGLRLIGRPSEEHSWFPGYAWTIAQCRVCANHMGWRFTVAPGGRELKPEKFYGLCQSSLKPTIQSDTDEVWVPLL